MTKNGAMKLQAITLIGTCGCMASEDCFGVYDSDATQLPWYTI